MKFFEKKKILWQFGGGCDTIFLQLNIFRYNRDEMGPESLQPAYPASTGHKKARNLLSIPG